MTALLLVVLGVIVFVALSPGTYHRMARRTGKGIGDAGRAVRGIARGGPDADRVLGKYEVIFGQSLAADIVGRYGLTPDAELQGEIRAIGESLVPHSGRTDLPYSFTVIEMREPNAMGAPGGFVFISRSLIDLCQGDRDEIAGVLSHELGHVALRHALRRTVASVVAKHGIAILSAGRSMIIRSLVLGAEELLLKGYSRDLEHRADRFAVDVSGKAGYDPAGLGRLLQRLRRPPGGPLKYLATHPPTEERVRAIERHILRRLPGPEDRESGTQGDGGGPEHLPGPEDPRPIEKRR